MTEPLVRFGVAMEASLLHAFDGWVAGRGSTRSEAIRDLARSVVNQGQAAQGAQGVAVLTLVYDHHVRELAEKLTELQHALGEAIRATLHIHLDHDHCLEVVILQGVADELRSFSDQLLGMRGVKHGGLEVIAGVTTAITTQRHPSPHRQPRAPKRGAGKKSAQTQRPQRRKR